MAKKSVISLRTYKGSKMLFDENGKAENENQIVKIQYGSLEWENFLNMANRNGYCKIEVEKAQEVSGFGENEKVEPIKDLTKYQEEVDARFKKEVKVELTPEQKRIAELEEKLEKLISGKEDEKVNEIEVNEPETVTENNEDVKDDSDVNDYPKDPEELRSYYEELMGKKPHHKASDETLIEQMNEFKSKK